MAVLFLSAITAFVGLLVLGLTYSAWFLLLACFLAFAMIALAALLGAD